MFIKREFHGARVKNGEEGLILVALRETHFPDCCLSAALTCLFMKNKQFRLHSPKIAQME